LVATQLGDDRMLHHHVQIRERWRFRADVPSVMLTGRPLTIWGDGRQTRDFTYVGDIAAANVAGARYGSGVYNIGTGLPTDILDLAREITHITGYTQKIQHGAAKPGEVRHSYLDSHKARRELGWQPLVTLADGLARTVKSLRV
jgi:UDP-glucose 4-epimerase